MKKTLVAVAALAFVCAASAQSTVTLSGSIDASVGKNRMTQTGAFTGSAGSQDVGVSVGSGTQNGSRWSLGGTEDLGGGMSANFLLVSGFNVDKGSSAQGGLLFGRQAWAGLKGGFGEIRAGRQETLAAVGPWGITGGYANYDAWYSTKGNAGFGNSASIAEDVVRKDNALLYMTPNLGGFQGKLMWAPSEDGVKNSGVGAGRYTSLGLDYYNGPIGITFAYETIRTVTPGAAAGAPSVGIVAGVIAIVPGAAAKVATAATANNWALGGSYDLGVVKLLGAYERASAGTARDRGYAVGLSAPLGPVSLDFEYAYEKTEIASVYASKASAVNLRVNYPLSKRTKFYTLLSNGTSHTAVVGSKQDLSRFQVGMRHVF